MPINEKDRPLGAKDLPEKLGPGKIEGLPTNKTLVVTKLTESPGETPELRKCVSIGEVFAAYQPSINVPITDAEGGVAEAEIKFQSMDDFGNDEAIISKVKELQRLRDLLALDHDLLDAVSSNEVLKKDLSEPVKRQRLVESLRHYLEELEKMG